MSATFSLDRHRPLATWLGCGFLAWTFIWDNSRQASADVTDPMVVLPVPRPMKVVELLAIVVLTVYAVTADQDRKQYWVSGTVMLMLAVLLASCGSVVGVLAGYTTVGWAIQTTYEYLSPLLLAVAVGSLVRPIDKPASALRVLTVLVGANGLVAWYQLAVRGSWGDGIHGAMHDAHVYANVAWITVLWVLVRLYCGYGSRLLGFMLLALLVPTAWAAQNETGNLVLAAVLGGALLTLLWRHGGRWGVLAIGGIIALSVRFVPTIWEGGSLSGSFDRFRMIAGNLSGLGVIEGYKQVPLVMAGMPHSLLVGTGPGSYGSAPALGAMLAGGQPPPLMQRFTAESFRLTAAARGFLGSFVEKSTDLTAAVVEFGPIATLCGLSALWLLVILPSFRATVSRSIEHRAVGHWVILAASYLLVLSCGTAFYGWSVAHTSAFAIVASGASLLSSQTGVLGPVAQAESRSP